jgi:hypothetical protein
MPHARGPTGNGKDAWTHAGPSPAASLAPDSAGEPTATPAASLAPRRAGSGGA